jgi:N-glycosylase/DNA lyase
MPSRINVPDFNLAATLECGQAFRWTRDAAGWYTGVVGKEVWRLRQNGNVVEWCSEGHASARPIGATTVAQKRDLPKHMGDYLTLDLALPAIVATFPTDDALLQAVKAHWGLRVLRQDPWETLASFIASSTKQIVQIRQIVAQLATRCGEPLAAGHYSFPSIETIARATPQQLLACKLGFRAKYLLTAAQMIDSGRVRFADVPAMEYERALEELQKIPGVGEKIANCVLLFAYGFRQAFPVDVWVSKALRQLYFPGRPPSAPRLRAFIETHFGPHAGYAQQYLFCYVRSQAARGGRSAKAIRAPGGCECRPGDGDHSP